MLSGKILITGGTGSLGTSLTADLLLKGVLPQNITLFARNETKINQARTRFPGVRCEIGDVRDLSWLQTLFPGHDYIIHAGALKVVPTAEVSVKETVSTNVIGSLNVAMAAVESGVKRVVGISTDKSCQPSVSYGATKFLMERLLVEADSWGKTTFNTVRYGNVMLSNASVIPLLQSLVRQNKPLTITQFSMTRFWLEMQESLDLIYDALLWEESGIILVPKAKASTMKVIADAVVPYKGYPIVEIGRRAGEKIHEKMIHAGETHHTRDIGKYFVIYHPHTKLDDPLPENFEYTSDTCEQFTVDELREKIERLS